MMMIGTPLTPFSKKRRIPASTPGGTKAQEEKILVTVRVRPLSAKEQSAYDLIAWEFTDEHTIVSKNLNHERHAGPYTFDKVFDPSCSNQKVYCEGARDVALSVLNGFNATIFAYGQTSSGKTFTMRGITENAIKDIYEHVINTPSRNFLLKFSALEIYNESVVDLLNRDSGTLRLLDDPEKGTTVEKLTEEIVHDAGHLRHLIAICEAQRQVGETNLNDKSSRSHQIIRLTLESSMRDSSECLKSLVASLNLVDLAGSERASQTNAGGTRLKEGSHINRSLLTLTTVIRKLSGKQSCHIPYRDSKLTRILQYSLGGNARMAIVCTMSPALSHVEQSRNTLSFAISAKEVTNNAEVNVKEDARLEACGSPFLMSLLLEKDLKIEKMEKEISEVKRQRDFALSQLELERSHKESKESDNHGPSQKLVKRLDFTSDSDIDSKPRKFLGRKSVITKSAASTTTLVQEIRKLEMKQRQLGEEANRALELLHEEVASHRIGSKEAADAIAKLLSEIKEMQSCNPIPERFEITDKGSLREEMERLNSQESNISLLEEKLESVQRSLDNLVSTLPIGKKTLPLKLNNKGIMPFMIRSPCSPVSSSQNVVEAEVENISPESKNALSSSSGLNMQKRGTPNTPDTTPLSKRPNSISVKKVQDMFKKAAEDNIQSIKAYVTELKLRVAKLHYQKELLVCQVLEMEASEATAAASGDESDPVEQSPTSWKIVFEEQRKQIIMLWHFCHVSLIHRTQFYLLFKGEPCDQIYLEVELRRLTWLEQHLSDLGNASPALLGDAPAGPVYSSIRALKQEREQLAKRVSTKLSSEEREALYLKWNIPEAEGKQRRRLQVVNKLWSDPLNMRNVEDSAQVVAKLVGFCESGEQASKEMFHLNFNSPFDNKKSSMIGGWNLISNFLHL